MPQFVEVLCVVPSFSELAPQFRQTIEAAAVVYPVVAFPSAGEEDRTEESLAATARALAGVCPGLTFNVLVRHPDWCAISCICVAAADVESQWLELSLQRDEHRDPEAEPAPEVPVALDQPADAFADLIARGSVDVGYETEEFELPFEYKSVEAMLEVLATVAGHLADGGVRVITEVDGAFYRCTLGREAVVAEPLWPWVPDAQLRQRVREVLPQPQSDVATVAAKRLAEISVANADAPLTSGSARARIGAAYVLFEDAGARWQRRSTSVAHWERLTKAVSAPENRAERFEGVRCEFYELICRFDVPGQAEFLLHHLPDEPEAVRLRAYPEMVTLGIDAVDRLLAQRFCVGTPAEAETIGQVIWRSDRAVELLVKEHLVPARDESPELADRIVRLLEEECIDVPREWGSLAVPRLARPPAASIQVGDTPSPPEPRRVRRRASPRVPELSAVEVEDRVRAALASYAAVSPLKIAPECGQLCALWCHGDRERLSAIGQPFSDLDANVLALFRAIADKDIALIEVTSKIVFSLLRASPHLYDVFSGPRVADEGIAKRLDLTDFDSAALLIFALRRVFSILTGALDSLLDEDDPAHARAGWLNEEIHRTQQELLTDPVAQLAGAPLLVEAEQYLVAQHGETSLPAFFARARHGLTVCLSALVACAAEEQRRGDDGTEREEQDQLRGVTLASLREELRGAWWAARAFDHEVELVLESREPPERTESALLEAVEEDLAGVKAFEDEATLIKIGEATRMIGEHAKRAQAAIEAKDRAAGVRGLEGIVIESTKLEVHPECGFVVRGIMPGLHDLIERVAETFDVDEDALREQLSELADPTDRG